MSLRARSPKAWAAFWASPWWSKAGRVLAPPCGGLSRAVTAGRLHVVDRRITDLRDRAGAPEGRQVRRHQGFRADRHDQQRAERARRPWRPSLQTLPELIAAIKGADGAMTFASVGQGSLPQLLGVLLQQRAGLKLVHVPYGGAAPATVDLVAGRIDLAFLNLPPLLPHIQSGKLRRSPSRRTSTPSLCRMSRPWPSSAIPISR